MKNFFGILCILALFAVSLGASASPDSVDTSPTVVVAADDFVPDIGTFVDYETFAPYVALVFCPVFNTKADLALRYLPVPESPNIGFADTNINTKNSVSAYSNLSNADPTVGKSAECNLNNGANELSSTESITAASPDEPDLGDPCVTNSTNKAPYPVGS